MSIYVVFAGDFTGVLSMIPNNCLLNASDLEEIKTFCFCISVPYYFTANNALKTQRAGNKVWVRKDERVVFLQEHIKKELETMHLEVPKNNYCCSCSVAFCSNKHDWIVNTNVKLRKVDLTNIWKIVEDAIFAGLGIDDSTCVFSSQSKCFLPQAIETPPHYIAVCLTTYKLNRAGENEKA